MFGNLYYRIYNHELTDNKKTANPVRLPPSANPFIRPRDHPGRGRRTRLRRNNGGCRARLGGRAVRGGRGASGARGVRAAVAGWQWGVLLEC
jgi:hypothetical protein